jgi:2-polyprenyl-3-methyl-5-hydroxy-6-metoxy-1,4-benzoquinol methylase
MTFHSYEETYYQVVYKGNNYRRNPPYKWRSFLKQILTYKQHGRLLDIGCGLGLFLKQAAMTFECTGCDM